MSLHEMSFNFSSMQWIVMAVIGVYSWIISRQSASAKDLLDLRSRIVALEEHMRHLPDLNQITKLHGDMMKVSAELKGLQNSIQPLSRQIERVSDYLMNHK